MHSPEEKKRRGALLKSAMQGAGVQQAEAAEMVGVSSDAVGTWVRGKNWNQGKAEALLRRLGVEQPAAYLNGTESKPEAIADDDVIVQWIRQLDGEVQIPLMFVGTWLQTAFLGGRERLADERRRLILYLTERQQHWDRE